MKDVDRRILPSGYSDLGVRFPFITMYIVMHDLNDNSKWLLTWNTTPVTSDGFGHISISNDLTPTRRESFIEYQQNEGPALTPDGEYTLIIRGGRLGINYTPFPQGQSAFSTGPRPYARQDYNSTPRLIYLTNFTNLTLVHLAWTPDFKS